MTIGNKGLWALLIFCLAWGLLPLVVDDDRGWDGCGGWHSRQKTAEIQLRNLGYAIAAFRRTHRGLPDGLACLTRGSAADPEPLLREIPLDPWDRPYDYEVQGSGAWLLRSRGEDGIPDTDDDVRWAAPD